MEKFLLGVFSEQLSRIIVGFRREQVTANLLNGKGEITNVELNVDVINDAFLSRYFPQIELASVHISKLSINVTSFANLRKAPIVILIETATVKLAEPLRYTEPKFGLSDLVAAAGGGAAGGADGARATRAQHQHQQQQQQPYGLFDRIGDNITVEIECLRCSFQTWGKFKTRLRGAWTPPAPFVTMRDVRYVSVDPLGEEGSPADVWRHNEQTRGRRNDPEERGKVMIYKKLSAVCAVGLLLVIEAGERGEEERERVITFLRDTPVELHIALHKRLRDAALLAVQIDASLDAVEVCVDAENDDVPAIVHAMAGLRYWLAKDRSLVDPLFGAQQSPTSSCRRSAEEDGSAAATTTTTTTTADGTEGGEADQRGTMTEAASRGGEDAKGEEGPTTVACSTTSDTGGTSARSLGGEEAEEGCGSKIAAGRPPRGGENVAKEGASGDDDENDMGRGDGDVCCNQGDLPSSRSIAMSAVEEDTTEEVVVAPRENKFGRASSDVGGRRRRRRSWSGADAADGTRCPLIALPGGVTIHERITVSLSVQNCSIRLKYGARGKMGYLQLSLSGLVAELILPKESGARGGYLQLSLSHVCLRERHNKSTRSVLVGGVPESASSHHAWSRTGGTSPPPTSTVDGDEEKFPFFEPRTIRKDPFGLSYDQYPMQAFGMKTSINCGIDGFSFMHEVAFGRWQISFDCTPLLRTTDVFVKNQKCRIDPRWHTGNWFDCLPPPDGGVTDEKFVIREEHLQPLHHENRKSDHGAWDGFSLYLRFSNLEIQVPAALKHDLRSGDIEIVLHNVRLNVSPCLPRSFLHGRICGSSFGDNVGFVHHGDDTTRVVEFPNDASDLCYRFGGPSCYKGMAKSDSTPATENSDSAKREPPPLHVLRAKITVSKFSVAVVPVISICDSNRSQMLVAPTTVAFLVSKEVVLPSSPLDKSTTSPTSAQQHVTFSLELVGLECNLDLHVISSTLPTLSHHARLMTQLADALAQHEHEQSPGVEAIGFRETSRQRHVFGSNTDTTGGRSFIFWIHLDRCMIHLWSQIFSRPSASNTLVLLSTLLLKQVELGIERVVVEPVACREKDAASVFSTSSFLIKACLSDAVVSLHHRPRRAPMAFGKAETANVSERHMSDGGMATLLVISRKKDTFSRGESKASGDDEDVPAGSSESSSRSGLSFRCHSQTGADTLTCALELSEGMVVVDPFAVEGTVTSLVDTLLAPYRTDSDSSFDQYESTERLFPAGTIGSAIETFVYAKGHKSSNGQLVTSDGKSGLPEEAGSVQQVSCLYLYSFNVNHLLILIPEGNFALRSETTAASPCFGIVLGESSFVMGTFPLAHEQKRHTLEVAAGYGKKKWRDLFKNNASGTHQILDTTQSVLMLKSIPWDHVEGHQVDIATLIRCSTPLVSPFSAWLYLHPSSVSSSLGRIISCCEEVDIWKKVWESVSSCVNESMKTAANLRELMRKSFSCGSNSVSDDEFHSPPLPDMGLSMPCCEGFLRSIREAKALTEDVLEAFAEHWRQERRKSNERNIELDEMKKLLFCKERQRVSALSTFFSQASGWMRLGGISASGQRISSTTTLWKYWVVLRQNVLMVFLNPGEVSPVDVIALGGAMLRSLISGGRKCDLKRSFCVLERTGRRIVCVVPTAGEYQVWVRELAKVIEQGQNKECSGSAAVDNSDGDLASTCESVNSPDDASETYDTDSFGSALSSSGALSLDSEQRLPWTNSSEGKLVGSVTEPEDDTFVRTTDNEGERNDMNSKNALANAVDVSGDCKPDTSETPESAFDRNLQQKFPVGRLQLRSRVAKLSSVVKNAKENVQLNGETLKQLNSSSFQHRHRDTMVACISREVKAEDATQMNNGGTTCAEGHIATNESKGKAYGNITHAVGDDELEKFGKESEQHSHETSPVKEHPRQHLPTVDAHFLSAAVVTETGNAEEKAIAVAQACSVPSSGENEKVGLIEETPHANGEHVTQENSDYSAEATTKNGGDVDRDSVNDRDAPNRDALDNSHGLQALPRRQRLRQRVSTIKLNVFSAATRSVKDDIKPDSVLAPISESPDSTPSATGEFPSHKETNEKVTTYGSSVDPTDNSTIRSCAFELLKQGQEHVTTVASEEGSIEAGKEVEDAALDTSNTKDVRERHAGSDNGVAQWSQPIQRRHQIRERMSSIKSTMFRAGNRDTKDDAKLCDQLQHVVTSNGSDYGSNLIGMHLDKNEESTGNVVHKDIVESPPYVSDRSQQGDIGTVCVSTVIETTDVKERMASEVNVESFEEGGTLQRTVQEERKGMLQRISRRQQIHGRLSTAKLSTFSESTSALSVNVRARTTTTACDSTESAKCNDTTFGTIKPTQDGPCPKHDIITKNTTKGPLQGQDKAARGRLVEDPSVVSGIQLPSRNEGLEQVGKDSDEVGAFMHTEDLQRGSESGTAAQNEGVGAQEDETDHSSTDGQLPLPRRQQFRQRISTIRSNVCIPKLSAAVKSASNNADEVSSEFSASTTSISVVTDNRNPSRRRMQLGSLRGRSAPDGESVRQNSIGPNKEKDVMKLNSVEIGTEAPSTRLTRSSEQKELLSPIGCWVVHVVADKYCCTSDEDCAEQSSTLRGKGDTGEETSSLNATMTQKSPAFTSERKVSDRGGKQPDEWFFRITLACPCAIDNESKSKSIERSLADVFSFHCRISDAIALMSINGGFSVTPSHAKIVTGKGDMKEEGNLLTDLGLSPLDQVIFVGRILVGILGVQGEAFQYVEMMAYRSKVLADFVNSLLACPLPMNAHSALFDFLDLHDWVPVSLPHESQMDHVIACSATVRKSFVESSLLPCNMKLVPIAVACKSELARAENRISAMIKQTASIQNSPPEMPSTARPPMASSALSSSDSEILNALISVMAERDEAHAQIISASVLHMHELDQERKRNERLKAMLHLAEERVKSMRDQANNPFFAIPEKDTCQPILRKLESLMAGSEEEMQGMCEQLSNEIQQKTSATMEVNRLKELNLLQKEHESAKYEALREELDSCRASLAKEQNAAEEARKETLVLKSLLESYQKEDGE